MKIISKVILSCTALFVVGIVLQGVLFPKPIKDLKTFGHLKEACGSSVILQDNAASVVYCETKEFEFQISPNTYKKHLEAESKAKEISKRKSNPRQPDKRWGISPAEAKIVVLQMCRLNRVLSDSYIQNEFYGVARRTGTDLTRILVWADMAKGDYKGLYDFERKRYTGSICHW